MVFSLTERTVAATSSRLPARYAPRAGGDGLGTSPRLCRQPTLSDPPLQILPHCQR